MRKHLVSLWVALAFSVIVLPRINVPFFAGITNPIAAAADSAAIKIVPELALTHPRRGHSLTVVGEKIWVTGGKAYESHFAKWGQDRFQKFTTNPNVEVIDLTTGKVTYTDIAPDEPYYKSCAFTVNEGDTSIYLAAANVLAKLDTQRMTFTPLRDIGVPGERTKASWGRMTIRGRKYVVIISEDKRISFFDPTIEQFVKIDGVVSELSVAGAAGDVIDNKFYIGGGNKVGDDAGGKKAWVFDPNAPPRDQLKPIADLPIPLAFPNAIAFKSKLYYFGGASEGDMAKTVFEYDPATDGYTRKADLPQALNNGAIAKRGDRIYIGYGYSWGTEAEGKLGFRTHPEYTLVYQPGLDSVSQDFAAKESVSGRFMDLALTWPDPDSITGPSQTVAVSWLASTASTKGTLYYRMKGAGAFEAVAAAGTTYHVSLTEAKSYKARLKDLKPATDYEYYAISEGAEPVRSATYGFTTQPLEASKVFQVFALGDSKSEYHITNELNGEILKRIRAGYAAKTNPAFLIHLGDFGAYGAFGEYQAWFNYKFKDNYTQELVASFPFLAVHGNHENLLPTFFNSFEKPRNAMQGWPALDNEGREQYWFSYNYGNTHFIVLTTGTYLTEAWYTKNQLEWLKSELAYAKQMKDAGRLKWVVVILHHPTLASGDHFKDLDGQGLHTPGFYLDAIEASNAVDVMLGAHDHDYERSKNVKGYRWQKTADGKISYVKKGDASLEEESGRFGEATQGKGIIHIVLGTAGAAQRSMIDRKKLGDSSWLAFRKPEPERRENAEAFPIYAYGILTITDDTLKIEVHEKRMSYLPNVTDDGFEGLLDQVTIKRK